MTGGEQDHTSKTESGTERQGCLDQRRSSGVWLAKPAGPAGEPSPARAVAAQGLSAWRALLLTDDAAQGNWLLEELRPAISAVAWATTGREGLTLARSGLVDVVISEMALPDLPGMDLLRELQTLPQIPKSILTTSRHSEFLAMRAIEHGASAVLCKPFGIEQLLALVAHLLGN